MQQAAQRLSDPRIGWSYVDQSQFCPALYALTDLRTLIVKRPVLTTLDIALRPIRGKRKTHLVTGYVHKPYPRIYALLARHAGFDSALLIRGVEGGIIPSLRQVGKSYAYHDKGEEQDFEINPEQLGIVQTTRGVPLPSDLPQAARPGDDIAIAVDINAMARAAASAGIAALEGQSGPVRDSLILAGALCLHHLHRYPTLSAAADAVRVILDDGSALARLRAGAV